MVKKPRKVSNNHKVISHFLVANMPNHLWPREMKLAGQMLKKYPVEFFESCQEPFFPKKLDSLAWFETKMGYAFLADCFYEYQKRYGTLVEKKEEIVLVSDKIGEDIVIEKRKTLKDFLNYGQKN